MTIGDLNAVAALIRSLTGHEPANAMEAAINITWSFGVGSLALIENEVALMEARGTTEEARGMYLIGWVHAAHGVVGKMSEKSPSALIKMLRGGKPK